MTFAVALSQTALTDMQKIIIKGRFVNVVVSFEHRCRFLSFWFHLSRLLVTVGSLIVPALLSIQYTNTTSNTDISDPGSFTYRIYWATWVISLLVTTSNGLSNIFRIDKKYYFLHTTLEQLKSEGWQYFELSGRYSGFFTPNEVPTHANQFIYFCHTVEKIKMKQVEEEYYKLLENHSQGSTQSSGQASGQVSVQSQAGQSLLQEGPPGIDPSNRQSTHLSLIPPSPLKNFLQKGAHTLPPELLKQLTVIAESQENESAIDESDKKSVEDTDESSSQDTEEKTKSSVAVSKERKENTMPMPSPMSPRGV